MSPKFFRDFRYKIFYGLTMTRDVPLVCLGDVDCECAWTFCPTGLNEDSVIYSGGVGNNISFEHALVERLGCNIVLFDPSPTGTQTMARRENQIAPFKFFPVALAGRPGTLRLSPPLNPEEGSWFTQAGNSAIEVPCSDLTSLMMHNNHRHIDLLKLDIEGSEYEVIDDMLRRGITVRQICVEYHHGMLPGIRRGQTVRSILKLLVHGYKLLDQSGNNHTFIHNSALDLARDKPTPKSG